MRVEAGLPWVPRPIVRKRPLGIAALGASGASSSVETVQLFTMEEAMTAMTKAGPIRKTYKPPRAA